MDRYEMYLEDGEESMSLNFGEIIHTIFNTTVPKDKNFYIKDDKAYTEDDILVYNVFVCKIPKRLSSEAIRTYFSQFGEVRTVRLVADRKRSKRTAPRVGFVNFTEATAAAKVLQLNNHRCKNFRIQVMAGDSWNQPHIHDAVSNADAESSEVCSGETLDVAGANALNVLALNDDCLEHILGYLELREQVRFSRVCQRFRNVFAMFCKREYKRLCLMYLENLTLWDIRDLLRIAGPHIDTLEGYIPYKNRERIAEFIGNCSTNLKCLDLEDCRMRADSLRKLLGKLKNLKDLHLNDCSLHDNVLTAMIQLRNLETLELSENYELTGRYLEKLTQLKVLRLYGCGNIQAGFLCEVCKSMPNLVELDVRRCLRISVGFLDALVEHCEQLEVLKISCSPDLPYERIAHLPRLKHLELLSSSYAARTALFQELSQHRADQLKILKIVAQNFMTYDHAVLLGKLKGLQVLICACNEKLNDACLREFCTLENLEDLVIRNCSVTNAGLLALLSKCLRLRNINVQRCKKVTTAFVFDAIKVLRQQRRESGTRPIVFWVAGTGINEHDIINSVEYKAAESLIKLSFDPFFVDGDLAMDLGSYDMLSEDDDENNSLFDDDDDDFDLDDDSDFYVSDELDEDDMRLAYNLFRRFAAYDLGDTEGPIF